MRGGGVLFFLVCKKIAFSTFPQQAIFFHLGEGGGKDFTLLLACVLVLDWSLCLTHGQSPRLKGRKRDFFYRLEKIIQPPPPKKKIAPLKKKSSPVQILVQSSPIQSPVLDSCENEHRTFSIFMKKKKRILLSWVANQIAVEID